jgi:CheY-like chemotaxis protein
VKVLLVESEEPLRNMARQMILHLGFGVVEAKDGVDAVSIFRQRRDEICCVISDLTMPRMNGWKTLEAIRNLSPKLPVILSSGYDAVYAMSAGHSEWPQAFLGKPYTLQALRSALRTALGFN